MDYAGLQTSIASLLNRTDMGAHIPGFIVLAEAQFNRDIRHWRMENRAYITTSGQYIKLPPDWLETIRILNATDQTPLRLLSRQAMQDLKASEATADTTLYYRHSEGNFEIWPAPSEDINLEAEYYQRIPSLSDSATTNWLLTYHPDIYLYGSAMHSAPFLFDDARLGVWSNLYSTAMTQLVADGRRAEMSQSSPRLRKFGGV
jgi:hypothetical protein